MAWDIINSLCCLYGSSKPKPCLVTANAVACRKKKSREFKPNTRNVDREMKGDHLPWTCHKCFFRISHPGTANGRHPMHMPGIDLVHSELYYLRYFEPRTLWRRFLQTALTLSPSPLPDAKRKKLRMQARRNELESERARLLWDETPSPTNPPLPPNAHWGIY